jgi:hypothetical protein
VEGPQLRRPGAAILGEMSANADYFCEIYIGDTPEGDPKSEAMLAHHFNREHDIAKRPTSALHGGRPDNGDMPINSQTRRAYSVEQLRNSA